MTNEELIAHFENLLPMFKDFASGFVEYIKGYWNAE